MVKRGGERHNVRAQIVEKKSVMINGKKIA